MALKIVRNDITRMDTQAVVNTASAEVAVGAGCDKAIYEAAGFEQLLNFRREKIGRVEEGQAFITPAFNLHARCIIHTVSPQYIDGNHGEEEKLRACYRNSLALARQYRVRSIAFPLIATGSFGYPKEEGLRIAVDEINSFLLANDMEIYLVVFGTRETMLGEKLYPDLEAYIDHNYVRQAREREYGDEFYGSLSPSAINYEAYALDREGMEQRLARRRRGIFRREEEQERFLEVPKCKNAARYEDKDEDDFLVQRREKMRDVKDIEPDVKWNVSLEPCSQIGRESHEGSVEDIDLSECSIAMEAPKASAMTDVDAVSLAYNEANVCMDASWDFEGVHAAKLNERIKHLSDTYSEYLLYLIKEKHMENAEVYKRAIVDKKIFSKIKNNPHYHPNKLTALCLCVGAKLNLDETKDLLMRAGYALSPCDMTDIIFSYFIENEIYDMIELDIQLEAHGLPCIIT